MVPDLERQSEAWFEVLLQSVPDGIIVVDNTGRVIEVNRRAEELFGTSRTDLVGQPVEVLLPDALRARHRSHRATYRADPVARAMGTGLELVAQRKGGESFLVDVSLSPVPGSRHDVLAVVRDVTEQKLALAVLAESEQRLRESEALAHVGGWVLDLATQVVHWSDELYRIHGVDPGDFDVTLDRAMAFVHPDDRSGATLGKVIAQRKSLVTEFRIVRADRQIRWLWARAEPVVDHHDAAVGVRGICQDVTERHDVAAAVSAAYERERAAAERLRAADLVKDEFLATVSHELRTPLTTILGFTALLHDIGDREQTPDVAERIERNARDMLGMVERVLDFSRLSAGVVEVNPETEGLDQLVRELLEDAPPRAGQTLRFTAGGGRRRVRADRDATRHILTNLLSNAAKFSPPDGLIEVSTSIEENFGVVSVADRGPGVPEALRTQVFERFFRGTDQPPGERGTGVGLAIAQRYAELQGGRIWCTTNPGGGAIFRFTLPLAGGAPPRRR